MSSICAFALACSNDDGTPASTADDESSGETETETETDESDTSDGADETETDGTDTDEPNPVCEAEEPVGDWLFWLPDGAFPNDVPENIDESCTVIADPQNPLAFDCPFGDFAIMLDLSPMPELPAPGAVAQVRIHHEPGWLEWPDLWLSIDVVGGDHYAFQASSVLLPQQGTYAVPWEPSETLAECGPFSLGDTCGEQVGKQLGFVVDGEPVSAWHGGHRAATIGDREFEVWINVAREYINPSETCDFSPHWYSVVSHREGAG